VIERLSDFGRVKSAAFFLFWMKRPTLPYLEALHRSLVARRGGLRMTIHKVKFLFRFGTILAKLIENAAASETVETIKEAEQQRLGVGHIFRDRVVHRGSGREIREDAASA
jgi:hypothetical protein